MGKRKRKGIISLSKTPEITIHFGARMNLKLDSIQRIEGGRSALHVIFKGSPSVTAAEQEFPTGFLSEELIRIAIRLVSNYTATRANNLCVTFASTNAGIVKVEPKQGKQFKKWPKELEK